MAIKAPTRPKQEQTDKQTLASAVPLLTLTTVRSHANDLPAFSPIRHRKMVIQFRDVKPKSAASHPNPSHAGAAPTPTTRDEDGAILVAPLRPAPTLDTSTLSEQTPHASPFCLRSETSTNRPQGHPPPIETHPRLRSRPETTLAAYYAVADQGVMIHEGTLARIRFRDFEIQYISKIPGSSLQSSLSDPDFEANLCVSSRFDPSKPKTFEHEGARFFNTYRPLTFEPVEGSIDLLVAVLRRLLDNHEGNVATMVSILAFLVQHPGKKLGYIPCFVTHASSNKELLGHLLMTLLGDKNTYVPDAQAFSGPFADWLLRTSTALLNHVQTTKTFQERMYYLLTAQNLSVMIKGKNSVQIPNVLNQLAFARELSDLEHFPDHRRLGVFEMSEQQVTSAEYTAFRTWLDGDGKAHVLHALLDHDLTAVGFDPQQAPSNMEAHAHLDALSSSPVQDFLQEARTSATNPMTLDLVNVNEVPQKLINLGHRVTTTDVRKALSALGAVRIGQIRKVEGQEGKPNYWAIRQQDYWAAQTEGTRRAYLEQAAQARYGVSGV